MAIFGVVLQRLIKGIVYIVILKLNTTPTRRSLGGEIVSAILFSYQHLKRLNAIRRAVPALQKGSWQWGGNAGANGVGYIRRFGTSEVVVGLAKEGNATFNFTGVTNGVYRDAVTGAEVTVSTGALSFSVAPSSAGIYVSLTDPILSARLAQDSFNLPPIREAAAAVAQAWLPSTQTQHNKAHRSPLLIKAL